MMPKLGKPPLDADALYPIVYLDFIHVKTRDSGTQWSTLLQPKHSLCSFQFIDTLLIVTAPKQHIGKVTLRTDFLNL